METTAAPRPAGREHRFRAVYTATYPDVLRFVTRRLHPSHAEDVVADAFLVVWRRWTTSRPSTATPGPGSSGWPASAS